MGNASCFAEAAACHYSLLDAGLSAARAGSEEQSREAVPRPPVPDISWVHASCLRHHSQHPGDAELTRPSASKSIVLHSKQPLTVAARRRWDLTIGQVPLHKHIRRIQDVLAMTDHSTADAPDNLWMCIMGHSLCLLKNRSSPHHLFWFGEDWTEVILSLQQIFTRITRPCLHTSYRDELMLSSKAARRGPSDSFLPWAAASAGDGESMTSALQPVTPTPRRSSLNLPGCHQKPSHRRSRLRFEKRRRSCCECKGKGFICWKKRQGHAGKQ